MWHAATRIVTEMKNETRTSIRISPEELRELHEIKNIVENAIGQKIRLGAAIPYVLRQLKTGRFGSINVSELKTNIEVVLRGVRLEYHPPSLVFQLEIDNRNASTLSVRQIDYRISDIEGYVFNYPSLSITKEVEFGAIEKKILQLRLPMDCYLIDFLHTYYEKLKGKFLPGITLTIDLHFMVGLGKSEFLLSKEATQKPDAGRWGHMMRTWKERFPRTLLNYKVE